MSSGDKGSGNMDKQHAKFIGEGIMDTEAASSSSGARTMGFPCRSCMYGETEKKLMIYERRDLLECR